jgi:hypothetical protein
MQIFLRLFRLELPVSLHIGCNPHNNPAGDLMLSTDLCKVFGKGENGRRFPHSCQRHAGMNEEHLLRLRRGEDAHARSDVSHAPRGPPHQRAIPLRRIASWTPGCGMV